MTNLDELERLHAGLPVLRAETWNHEDGEGYAAIIAVLESDCDDDEHPGAYDAAVNGVKILNVLPGLIAELRALREVAEAAAHYGWLGQAFCSNDCCRHRHWNASKRHVVDHRCRRLITQAEAGRALYHEAAVGCSRVGAYTQAGTDSFQSGMAAGYRAGGVTADANHTRCRWFLIK